MPHPETGDTQITAVSGVLVELVLYVDLTVQLWAHLGDRESPKAPIRADLCIMASDKGHGGAECNAGVAQ
jgi:hypothetical protein